MSPSTSPQSERKTVPSVMPKILVLAAATLVATTVLLIGMRIFGATSAAFAFLVVWAPMTWLGTVSRIFQPRLPRQFHELRDFERDPRLYELLGVKVVKRFLRRGPLAMFNPRLHLPTERTPERLLLLEQSMKDAEASHFVLLVAMLGVVVHAAARGWWVAAGLTLLFDLLMSGYPVMLQRYNRALLHERFPHPQPMRTHGPDREQGQEVPEPNVVSALRREP